METKSLFNVNNINTTDCDGCVHDKVCMYKNQIVNMKDSLKSNFIFIEDHPFMLNINCKFRQNVNALGQTIGNYTVRNNDTHKLDVDIPDFVKKATDRGVDVMSDSANIEMGEIVTKKLK